MDSSSINKQIKKSKQCKGTLSLFAPYSPYLFSIVGSGYEVSFLLNPPTTSILNLFFFIVLLLALSEATTRWGGGWCGERFSSQLKPCCTDCVVLSFFLIYYFKWAFLKTKSYLTKNAWATGSSQSHYRRKGIWQFSRPDFSSISPLKKKTFFSVEINLSTMKK